MKRKHPKAKLETEQVRAIRQNRYGKSQRKLAQEYGVHINTIKRIALYMTWKHV